MMVPYAVLFAAIFLFYYKLFLLRGAWLICDHAEQHFPWAFYLAEHLKHGKIPFWTDQIQSGFPIAAEGQMAPFYLPNLFFYGLFPIRAGYAWNIVFHLLVSGFLMFRYLETLKIKKGAALFGSLVYLFGSTLGGAYYNITSLKVLTWFPWTLILIDDLTSPDIKKRNAFGRIILLGFLFSLQLLAGYLQYAVYAILFSGLYFLFRWMDRKRLSANKTAVISFGLLAAVVFAAILSFPQLLLTYRLAIQSGRANLPESFAYIGSYSPGALLCLIFPSLESLFASKVYLGVIPLLFILISICAYRKSSLKSAYWLAAVALLLALGGFSPLYIGMVKLLHFHSFRTPVKFIFFFGFFLCVLAAQGMDILLKEGRSKTTERGIIAFAALTLFSYFAVVLAHRLFLNHEQELYELGRRIVEKTIYGKTGHPYDWQHYAEKLTSYMRTAQTLLDPSGDVIRVPVAKIILSFALIFFFLRRWLSPKWFSFAAGIFLIVDLYTYGFSDIQRDYASYRDFFAPTGVVTFLKEHLGRSRYLNYTNDASNAPLPAAKNMIWGLRSVNAYSPLALRDYYDLLSKVSGVNDSTGYPKVDDKFLYRHLKMLGFLNVKYIVSDRALDPKIFRNVYSDGHWSVYQNPEEQADFFLLSDFKVEADRRELFKTLLTDGFDPTQQVLLESEPVFSGKAGARPATNALIVYKDEEENRSFQVQANKDLIFVISSTFDAGWKVWVDGSPVKLLRANGVFTGVALKQGEHSVEMKYSP